jgi:nitrogen-specific signal transduction histidine kinase
VTEALLEALPFSALLLDSQARVVAVNAEMERITGRGSRHLIGKPFFEAFADLDGAARIAPDFTERVLRGALNECCLTPLPSAAAPERSARVHLRSVRKEGEPLVLVLLEPIAGDAQLRSDLDRARGRLRATSRIKHEISNPLMGLLGTAELLEGYPDLPDRSRQRLTTILHEARRIQEQLLELSRTLEDDAG